MDLGAADEDIRRTVLDSGARIVSERMPGSRSVTIGITATVGSRDEAPAVAGASHFLEHLLFKGTESRTARGIAMAVDAVGGEMNAYTGREGTSYYLRLPSSELDFGLDLLGDVVKAPAFRANEVESEREVIIEELLMAEDDPDDVVHQALYEAAFPGHPIGRETLGSMESIPGLDRDSIAAFHAEHYRPANLVIAAAGDLDHDVVIDRMTSVFGGANAGGTSIVESRQAPDGHLENLTTTHRDTEQVHLQMAWRSLALRDTDRFALFVANHVLGGGMASRLFTEVREERGLAYAVYSGPSLYTDTGLLSIYAGTGRARLGELLRVIDEVLEGLLADGITDEEHAVALGYLEGATVLGLEDSGSRMSRLASNEVVWGEVVPLDVQLGRLRSVTPDQVLDVLRKVLGAPRTVAAVGVGVEGDPLLESAAAWRR